MQYAGQLVECGLFQQAEAYCSKAGTLAQKAADKRAAVPYQPAVVIAAAQVLQERMKGCGGGRKGPALTAGSVIGRIGAIFDQQISKFISNEGPSSNAPSLHGAQSEHCTFKFM